MSVVESEKKDMVSPVVGKIFVSQLPDNAGVEIKTTGFSDDVGIVKYEIYQGKTLIASDVPDKDGQLVYKYEKADLAGKLSFSVIAYDASEKKSKEVKKNITIKDTTPPGKVIGLTCKDGADEKLTFLEWTAVKDNSGIPVSYEIQIDGEGKIYKSKTTSLTLKKLTAGEHFFQVRAVDKAKYDSGWSAEQSFTVADKTAPKVGKVTLTALDNNAGVMIKTEKSSDNVDVGVKYYTVKIDGQTFENIAAEADGNLKFTYNKENIAGKITCEVIAHDAAGNDSKAVKRNITIKDMTPPSKVIGLTCEDGANEKNIVLSWDPATDNSTDPISYEIQIDGKGKIYKSKTTSLTLKKLAAGDDHTFVVRAVDKAKKKSDWSAEQSFTVADITAPKVGKVTLKALDNNAGVTITTTKSSDNVGIAEYDIYLGDKLIASDVSADSSNGQLFYEYKEDGLNGKLSFSVVARDAAGNASKAAKRSITIKNAVAPNEPSGKGLNKTIDTGYGWGDDLPWPWPDKVKVAKIEGTAYADVIKFKGDTLCCVAGISLGAGDDSVTLLKSPKEEGYVTVEDNNGHQPIDFGDGNDTLKIETDTELQAEIINFGSGNDKFLIAFDGNYFTSDEASIDFGAGDDLWEIEEDGDIDCMYKLDVKFGEGNDTFRITNDCDVSNFWAESRFDFGAGNDTLEIQKDALFALACESSIDFGDGTDNLILNGNLAVCDAISGLEKVSGKGVLMLADVEGVEVEYKKEDFKLFTDAGIDVVNVQKGCRSFTNRKQEEADNTVAGARLFDQEEEDGYTFYEADFWLCGSEYAKNEVFGFADEVDYIKFTKTSDMEGISNNYENSEDLHIQIFDKNNNVLYDDRDPETKTFADIEDGTACILKLSVNSDSYASGHISISSASM